MDLGENVMVKNITVKNRIRSITVALILLICCSGVQGASSNLLRLEAPCGWSQHIVVPQGSTAYLVVLAAKEGIGELKELSPNGEIHNYNYFFRRYDHLPFYADTPGRHVLSYTIDGIQSNPVQIDVIGGCASATCLTPNVVVPVGGIHA
jgi:hypothetical protein